jgi:hypothetical protein
VRHPVSRQVPPHAPLRPDPRLLAQTGAAAIVAVERTGLVRAPRARVSLDWVGRGASSSSTISKKAGSRRTSTIRRPICSIVTSSRTTASSRCPVASATLIAKEKANLASATPRRRRCRGCARDHRGRSRVSQSLGRAPGRHPHPRTTKRQVATMFAEEQLGLQPLPRPSPHCSIGSSITPMC